MKPRSIRWWAGAVAAVAVAFYLIRPRWSDNLSCHLCRNLRVVDSSGLDRLTTAYPIPPGHVHDWSRYSRRRWSPVLGDSVACRNQIYKDGGTAPDGRR